jgi:hypothetical protein
MDIYLRIAGALLLLIAVAGACAPWVLAYGENNRRVDPIVREIFYIHNVYMTLFVLAFAIPCLTYPCELAGTPLGRFFCGFLGFAWSLRLAIQLWYHNTEIKRAYPAMNVLFSTTFLYLGVVFAVAAARGG